MHIRLAAMDALRGYQRNVELTADGTPVLNVSSNEQLHVVYSNVTLKFKERNHGSGSVYITTARLVWIPGDSGEMSYGFPYLGMVLHAISKDKALYESPCVFIQLERENPDDEEEEIPILVLVPANPEEVEGIFEAISQMNALIPAEQSETEDERDCELDIDDSTDNQ